MFKNSINTSFHLYQSENATFKSSFFEMINGNNETKQTKGLAYLFNLSPEFLRVFLSLPLINSRIKKMLTKDQYRLFKKSDFIKINAEMVSSCEEKIRRDITLTFYYKSLKVLVLIIEAKSIKFANVANIEEQIAKYINPKYFPDDMNIPIIPITLTRHSQTFLTDKFLSLTWSDVIQSLDDTLKLKLEPTKLLLLRDYFNL